MTTAVRSTGVRGERGVALIVVLLLLGLLLTIVAEFAQAMRLEAVTALNFRSALSETWLAQAAYQRALAEILPEAIDHELDLSGALVFRRSRIGTPAPPERLDVLLGPGRLSYRVTDENARMNLNRLGVGTSWIGCSRSSTSRRSSGTSSSTPSRTGATRTRSTG